MKICRFDDNRLGLVRDDMVYDVTHVLNKLPASRYPLPGHDPLIAALPRLKKHLIAKGKGKPVSKVKLLSPVANPGKLIAAPVNYKKHLEEALADKGIHHGNLVQ